jgi:hypothetical protein
LLTAFAFLLALPTMATASAEAQPVTLGDWMRTIFVTPDCKVDTAQKGVAAAPPPVPVPALQSSSAPAAPKEPVAQNQVARFWLQPEGRTKRRRRRSRR